MRKISFIILAIFLSFSVNAQEELTLENAVLKQYRDYYPSRLYQFNWMPNGGYSFVENNELIITNNQDIKKVRLSDLKVEKMAYIPPITWKTNDSFNFSYKNKIYTYTISTSNLDSYEYASKKYTDVSLSPNKQNTLALKNGDLYLKTAKKSKRIVKNNKEDISYAKVVHRHEFGISKGAFWSPKSNFVAYYRNDESDVANYPIVHTNTRIASLEEIKYPMAGEKSEKVSLEILNVEKRKKTKVKTGKTDKYLTNIAFGPEEEFLYIAELNRDQNHLKFNKYNVKTGKFIQTLFEEKSDKYVQPLHSMIFIPGHKNEFLWRSKRDGFDNLYRYNTNGELLNKVTELKGDIADFLGFFEGRAIFTAYTKNGMETQVFSSDIINSSSKQVTTEPGMHRAKLSSKGLVYDVYSNLNTPHISRIVNLKGEEIKVLLKSKNPLANIKTANTKLATITSADGKTTLNTRMILPKNFDANNKYPALVYVYNGPNVQLITNSWLAGASLWMHHLANKGYIVYTVDGRGSSNRGRDFEQVTFRDLGFAEMADQIEGVNYLKSLSYINKDRIAVHGWSYGGYMTTGLLLHYPKTFSCGIAGGPVMNWDFYEVMYTERYMDTPQTNKEGFEKTDWTSKVDKLQDPLLLIHGAIDDVVVWQHSLEFVRNCVSKGIEVDYFAYPEHKHNVRGKDRVHLIQKVINYLELHNK